MNIRKGFSLVELLVVLFIIGVLASIVVVNVNPAREEARNARKSTDIGQYTIGLRLLAEKWGAYPDPGSGWVCLGDYPNTSSCWDGLVDEDNGLNDKLKGVLDTLPVTTDAVGDYVGYRYQCYPNCDTGYRIQWYMYGPDAECDPGKHDRNEGDISLCVFES